MKEFRLNTDSFEEKLFEDIYLVLEHKDEKLRYLIEIDIKRVHLADEMPLNITVNGVINELEKGANETEAQLQSRIEGKLKNQRTYDAYVTTYRKLFDNFVAGLEQTLRTAIRCEEVKQQAKPQVMRPASKGTTRVTDRSRAPLAHQGFPGWQFAAIYTLMWMPAMSSASVAATDVEVVSDAGDVLQDIGSEAVDVSDSALFDMDIDTSDLPMDNENRFDAGVGGADGGGDAGDSGGSSWLDFGGGDSGGDGGSSCGSSCGGGCGG
jgi:hypothetical protein